MRNLADIDMELAAAKRLLENLREERAALIVSKYTRAIGEEFDAGGMTYRVKRLTANPNRSEIYVECQWKTGKKTWSQGYKTLSFPVGA